MARLVVLKDDCVIKEIELGLKDIVIGRGRSCDIVLDDPARTLSREHCEVRLEDGGYSIVDVGSQNGVWNGAAQVQHADMVPGLVFTIGAYAVRLDEDALPDQGKRVAPASDRRAAETISQSPQSERPETLLSDSSRIQKPTMTWATPTPTPTVVQPAPPPIRRRVPTTERPAGIRKVLRGPSGLSPVFVKAAAACALLAVMVALGWALWLRPSGGRPVTGQDAGREPAVAGAAETDPLQDAQGFVERGQLDDARAAVRRALAKRPGNAQALALQARIEALARADTTSAPPPDTPVADAAPVRPPVARVAAPAEPAPWPLLAPRPDEKGPALRERSRLMFERVTQAQRLLASGQFPDAVTALSAISAEEPAYPGIGDLVSQARKGIAAEAQRILDEGVTLEGRGDLSEAMVRYQRAVQLDASLAGADARIRGLRDRMVREGRQAYVDARQYDFTGEKAKAIALYERAVSLLPPDDPKYVLARDRLKALGVGRL